MFGHAELHSGVCSRCGNLGAATNALPSAISWMPMQCSAINQSPYSSVVERITRTASHLRNDEVHGSIPCGGKAFASVAHIFFSRHACFDGSSHRVLIFRLLVVPVNDRPTPTQFFLVFPAPHALQLSVFLTMSRSAPSTYWGLRHALQSWFSSPQSSS